MLKDYYCQNGWNNLITETDLEGVEKYLQGIKDLQYIGHGGTCIAFSQ